MRNRFTALGALALLIFSMSSGCAPSPAPTAPPVTPKATVLAPQAVATKTAEELAWDKTVEAAKREGRLTAYSFTWVGDIGIAVSRAFKDRYGIQLEIITGRGAEFLERLKTEKRLGHIEADMWEGSTLHTNNIKREGLLASVVGSLPVMREKGVWLVEPTAIDPTDKANLAWRLITYSPYVNTKSVKNEDIPRSWKDLLDPKWKGKMTLTDPNISGVLYTNVVTLMENNVWNEDYLRGLYRQQLRFPNGPQEEARVLATGEYQLAILLADVSSARFVMEGAPIQAIDMKEGIVLTTGSVAAIAGGPHPNAAKVFLNWLLSPEGISVAGKAQGNMVVRKDVPDFRPKGVQLSIANPLTEKVESIDKATKMFQEKWINKIVER